MHDSSKGFIKKNIISAEKNMTFESYVTKILRTEIKKNINIKNYCNFIITGGNTAGKLYNYWAIKNPWVHYKVKYCLSDERRVKINHDDSNYNMVKKNLFKNKKKISNFFYLNENKSLKIISDNFMQYINKEIDLTLLSIGNDGHFASIFPNTGQIFKKGAIIHTYGNGINRLSLSANILKNSKKIFILVSGRQKAKILFDIINTKKNIDEQPAQILLKSKWILDYEASNYLKKLNSEKVN